jgi:glycosyltransferase involved in cell wall biosynthesis
MVYKTAELLNEMDQYLKFRPVLRAAINFLGQLDHDALPERYQHADFYISSSHREGGSVAILEAMACGCIPIVSQLPSSLSNIDCGRLGFSFPAGNEAALLASMQAAINSDRPLLQTAIRQYFSDHYSIEAIAAKMFDHCEQLIRRVPE